MYLDEVKVVHEVGRGDILTFFYTLQAFCTAVLFLGNGIETVAVTSPLAQDLTDAAWLWLPGLLSFARQNIVDVGVLQHPFVYILAVGLRLIDGILHLVKVFCNGVSF